LTVKVTAVESLTVPDIIMDGRFVITESRGDETTNVGGVRSTLTVLEIVVVLPAASFATIVILFVPSARLTVVVNVPFEIGTLFPLIVKVTVVESFIVPETLIDESFVIVESRGDDTVMAGAVQSAVTVLEIVTVLPTASAATTVIIFVPCFKAAVPVQLPFWAIETAVPLTDTITACASVAVPDTVMEDLFVIMPMDGAETVSDGGVESRTTLRIIVVVLL
jgi:hypothetical protein